MYHPEESSPVVALGDAHTEELDPYSAPADTRQMAPFLSQIAAIPGLLEPPKKL